MGLNSVIANTPFFLIALSSTSSPAPALQSNEGQGEPFSVYLFSLSHLLSVWKKQIPRKIARNFRFLREKCQKSATFFVELTAKVVLSRLTAAQNMVSLNHQNSTASGGKTYGQIPERLFVGRCHCRQPVRGRLQRGRARPVQCGRGALWPRPLPRGAGPVEDAGLRCRALLPLPRSH